MSVAKETMTLFKRAAIVGVVAGIVAYVLSMVIPQSADPVMGLVLSLLPLLILIVVGAMVKGDMLKRMNVRDLVVFLAAIGIVGSVVAFVYAPIAPFILSVGDALTISGLLWTFVYITVSELVLNKLKVKA